MAINPDNPLKGDPDCEHSINATQCEEGCGCNYIHLMCDQCGYYTMANGWEGCNIDYEYKLQELKDKYEQR